MRIPFKWSPYSWGMKGKTRARAQAEHELTGYELDAKLAEIDLEGVDFDRKMIELLYKYEKISNEEYEARTIDLMDDGVEKDSASVETLFKFGHLSRDEADKQIATINNEPFFTFDISYEAPTEEGMKGSFELDASYNEVFIEHIKTFGYVDGVDSTAIDAYISDMGRKISQTEDETLLDENDQLSNSIIKSESVGPNTFYG